MFDISKYMYTQLLGALGLTVCMVVKFTFPFMFVCQ